MSFNFKDVIKNVFHSDEKEKMEEQKKKAELQNKANTVFGTNEKTTSNTFNPFLKKDGRLVNRFMNYQMLLDSPKVSQKAKDYITQATGLSPTVNEQNTVSPSIGNTYSFSGVTVQPDTAKATSNNIADAAQKYIGTPYVWGGESMSEGGMDCSGFVYNALKDAGYDVRRTTAQGYRNYGKSVNKSDLQAGDLIFYGKGGEASHIGIYIGNGQVIHSSGGSKNTKTNPGKGVIVSNVDHRSDFIEARRI